MSLLHTYIDVLRTSMHAVLNIKVWVGWKINHRLPLPIWNPASLVYQTINQLWAFSKNVESYWKYKNSWQALFSYFQLVTIAFGYLKLDSRHIYMIFHQHNTHSELIIINVRNGIPKKPSVNWANNDIIYHGNLSNIFWI